MMQAIRFLETTAVKFCGLCQPADVEAFNELHPDYVGFVFHKGSPREVNFEQAVELRRLLDQSIPTVGVFVNGDPNFITHLFDEGVISIAQLHGGESEQALAQLRSLAPDLELWKAFIVTGPETPEEANASSADRVMLDASRGAGKTFCWDYLEAMKRPFILAGGLDPTNVKAAVDRYHPAAVDVSSGIESDRRAPDGRSQKDREKMEAFIQAIRE